MQDMLFKYIEYEEVLFTFSHTPLRVFYFFHATNTCTSYIELPYSE